MSTPAPAGGRPAVLVVVCGTATEIGKTWVTAALSRHLAGQGVAVAARKPAQSFDPVDRGPTDAEVLGAATGEAPEVVCPPRRWYPVPMAPPMAAAHLGRPPPTIGELVAELTWPGSTDLGLVETAGGVASPQADDGSVAELVTALRPELVFLIADAGLGTINAVRLSMAVLSRATDRCAAAVVVHLNRFDPTDPLHRANASWLTDRDGLTVTTHLDALAAVVVDHR